MIAYLNSFGIEDSYLVYDIFNGLYNDEILKIYPYFKNPLTKTATNLKLAIKISLEFYATLTHDKTVYKIIDNNEIMSMFRYKKVSNVLLCRLYGRLYGYDVSIEFLFNKKIRKIDEVSFTYYEAYS